MNERRLEQLESRLGALDGDDADSDEDALARNPFWKLLSSPLGKDGFFSRFMREIFDMQSSPDKEAAESGRRIEGRRARVQRQAQARLQEVRLSP